MHMKSTHSAESGGKPIAGSTRRHINSRLQKAAVYAQHLVELLEDQGSGAQADDVLEARAYYVSSIGAVDFEKRKWEDCLRAYSEARLIYVTLAKLGNTMRGDTMRDLLSANIDPSIRYAAYQLKLPRTTSIDAVVALYMPPTGDKYLKHLTESNADALNEGRGQQKGETSVGSVEVPKTIRWRSREVNLEDAATAQALAAVSAAEVKLSSFLTLHQDSDAKAKASAYDEVLIPSQDAVDATKTALDELASEGVSQGDSRMQALQITRTAVNYALVGWRIGRNRVLCGDHDGASFSARATNKPDKPSQNGTLRKAQEESTGRKLNRIRERVVLYDATLQSLDSIKELPGVAADQQLLHELGMKRSYFATLRCLSLARSYSLSTKPKEALALFARALETCPRDLPITSENADTQKPPSIEVSPGQADSLQTLLRGLVLQHRGLVELQTLHAQATKEEESKSKHALPLIERLDEYPVNGADLTNLVTYPPKLQPIPVKPLFFDIAWNYLEYPGRPKKVPDAVNGPVDGVAGKSEQKKDAKKGWFGFARSK